MSNILANSYDSNSYVVLKNVFEPWEIDELIKEYDEYYKLNARDKLDEKAVSVPLTGVVEYHKPIAEIISRKERLFNSVKAVLGKDCQFIGSETIQVKNDTHGPHRDYCFTHDTLKALICLTGRYEESEKKSLHQDQFTLQLDGAFMINPGSHHIQGRQSFLNQQRTEWPSEKLSRYEQVTNSVLLGDSRTNGDYYYPNLDAQGRYAGFQHIPFEKGDVILFSTRAIHALYPQRNDFMMHFIGLLFVEDFMQGYLKNTSLLDKLKDIFTLNIRNAFLEYSAQPVISSIIYQAIRPHLKNYKKTKNQIKVQKIKKDIFINESNINLWNPHQCILDRENIRTRFIRGKEDFYFYKNINRLNIGLKNYLQYKKEKNLYKFMIFIAKAKFLNPILLIIDIIKVIGYYLSSISKKVIQKIVLFKSLILKILRKLKKFIKKFKNLK